MQPVDYIAIIGGTILGGFVQGISGFAFGLAAMGVWAWHIEPARAGPMVVWGSLIGQMLSLYTVRQRIDIRRAAPFVAGGIIGVPIGVWLLHFVSASLFKIGLGTLLCVYCTITLVARQMPVVTRGGKTADGAIGMIGGVMGGLGGLTGPVPSLWCLFRGWDKDAQRAVFQVFNLAMHCLTLALYVAAGIVDGVLLRIFVVMVPVVIVPTLTGVAIYRRFSDFAFKQVVLLLLAASGLMLLATAFR